MAGNKTNINLNDYSYTLPEYKIARYALSERACSKLLVYDKGNISHTSFENILNFIPPASLMVFNNTRVIPARIVLHKKTGARIEIFCLEPLNNEDQIDEVLLQRSSSTWKCLIGNKKKWKDGEILKSDRFVNGKSVELRCKILDREGNNFIINFEWNSNNSFSEILDDFGSIPIPPYLKREAEDSDYQQYQTVYAEKNGAVAAPTAGLHFTGEIFDKIRSEGINTTQITLHVSAGTFQPVKEDNVFDHPMHSEQIIFTSECIQNLIDSYKNIICVGTTSLRALESLYWYGVKLLNDPGSSFDIEKLIACNDHDLGNLPNRTEALELVMNNMKQENKKILVGNTSIFLMPGYEFNMCDGLITNYHMPKSTLILLVAAFAGKDWRKIYNEALNNDYRFLSYGDSSLILP